MNGNEIAVTIKEKLSQIERRENIRILYACESGSRAWGFASPDSDYDVRFIYVRPAGDYLKVKAVPDFLECELNEVYDINGWDLKKFFKQLYKSNPVIFEWANSPIVYRTTPEWEKVRAVMADFVCPKRMVHHYLGLAKCTMKKYFVGDTIVYKKYFYVLRAVLAASWVFWRKTPAPTEFAKLSEAELYPDNDELFEDERDDLYGKKTSGSEKACGKRLKGLEIFINNRIAIIENGTADWEEKKFAYEKLDRLLLELIQAGVAGGV